MDETWILQRFLARDEEGLAAAYAQLGPGLTALAARIAGPETAEECVNDALLAAWQAIPPACAGASGGLSGQADAQCGAEPLSRAECAEARRQHRRRLARRAGGVPAGRRSPADRAEAEVLRSALSAFLRTLPERQRQVFLARYFYALPLSGIAARFSMRENTVKTTLHRTRRRLRDYLEQEELL